MSKVRAAGELARERQWGRTRSSIVARAPPRAPTARRAYARRVPDGRCTEPDTAAPILRGPSPRPDGGAFGAQAREVH